VKKVEACVIKDPSQKEAMESGLKPTRESWKQKAAQGGAAKESLKQVCGAAVASLPATCK